MNAPREWPRITIVTPSYNQAQYLEATLQSVLSQEYPNLEYIVMDGGSTDGSVDIIRRYASQLAYWQTKPDGGQSAAINAGFKRASGQIYGWLNSDDVLKPGSLFEVASRFTALEEPQWLIGGCELSFPTGEPYVTRLGPWDIKASLVDWYDGWFTQQATFWTAAMWQRAGPLQTKLEYAMDYELWLRMGKLAAPVIVRRQLAGYRQHGEAKCYVHWAEAACEVRVVASRHLRHYVPGDAAFRRWRFDTAVGHLRQARAACRAVDFSLAFLWLKLALRLYPGLLVKKSIRRFSVLLALENLSLERVPANPSVGASFPRTKPTGVPAFVMPDGLILSGVNAWLLRLSAVLDRQRVSQVFLEHHSPGQAPTDSPALLPRSATLHLCEGRNPYWPSYGELERYLPSYRRLVSCTVIPNWSYATYAACARVRIENPEAIRVIGYAHSDEWNYYHWLSSYEQAIDRFVAVSEEVAQKLREKLPPYRHADVLVKPYGVAVSSHPSRLLTSASQPLRLLYAGRLEVWQKRVDDLIVLAETLCARGVNFTLKIAGDGSHRPTLENQLHAASTELRRRVELLGRVPYAKMQELWQEADVCVLTSSYEGTSVSMLEAMAQGCVPVVTRVSGVKAVVQEGVNGHSVAVGDIAGMADRIQFLASNRAVLHRMGQQAHAVIVDRFSIESYAGWFTQLCREVWDDAPRIWPRSKKMFLPIHPQDTWYLRLFHGRYGIRTRLKRWTGFLRLPRQRKGT